MPRILIVADDLTGAVDVAAALQRTWPNSMCVVSPWSEESERNWNSINDDLRPDVLCINTDSRNSPQEEARRRVKSAVAWSAKKDFRLMKKVDSLLRGNVFAEIDEFLGSDSLNSKPALFAPALPNQRRITRDGIQIENGNPVSQSQAFLDPLSPSTESNLRNLIPHNRLAVLIPLDQVRRNELSEIAVNFSDLDTVFIPDVETNADLEKLFNGAMLVEDMSLIGSSGLVSSDASLILKNSFDGMSDLLIVSASLRSEVKSQIDTFTLSNPKCKTFEFELNLENSESEIGLSLLNSFKMNKNVVLTVSPKNLILENLIERKEIAHSIVHQLAKAAYQVVSSANKPMILVLLGGDLSQEFCDVASISVLTVTGTACQGGAICRISNGGNLEMLTLILRSGGFGDRTSLLELRESPPSIEILESE